MCVGSRRSVSQNANMGLEHGTWGIKVDQRDFTSASLSSHLELLIARDTDGTSSVSPFYVSAQRLSASLKAHPKRPVERAGDILEKSLRDVVLQASFGVDPVASIPRMRGMTTLEYMSPYLLFVCLCIAVLLILFLCLYAMLSMLARFLLLLSRNPMTMRSLTKEKAG